MYSPMSTDREALGQTTYRQVSSSEVPAMAANSSTTIKASSPATTSRPLGLVPLVAAILLLHCARGSARNQDHCFIMGETAANDNVNEIVALFYLASLYFILKQRWMGSLSSWFQIFRRSFFPEKSELNKATPTLWSNETADGTTPLPRAYSRQGLCRNASSETISKLSSSIRNFSIRGCRKLRSAGTTSVVLSAQELFASNDDVGRLNLRDVTQIFRYVMEVNSEGFRKAEFMSCVSPTTKNIISAMDVAVSASRGPTTKLDILAGSSNRGEVDALYFAAAVRVYTEWRTVCLVPEGYKRYSIGVKMARRDIIQNLEKLEKAVHSWIETTQLVEESAACSDGSETHLVTPTLRQLLEHEVDTGVHTQLPCLTEHSGANGLLWIKRQLELVNTTFMKSLQVPKVYSSNRAASEAAYKEIYGAYHGWAIQQIFRHSFQGSPDFDTVLKLLENCFITGIDDSAAACTMPNLLTVPVIVSSGRVSQLKAETRDRYNDDRKLDTAGNEDPLDNFVKTLGKEWSRFTAILNQLNCNDIMKEERKLSGPIASAAELGLKQFQVPMRSESDVSSDSESDVSSSSTEDSATLDDHQAQTFDIYKEMEIHTEEMTKVLDEITHLITELNMNDPTKV